MSQHADLRKDGNEHRAESSAAFAAPSNVLDGETIARAQAAGRLHVAGYLRSADVFTRQGAIPLIAERADRNSFVDELAGVAFREDEDRAVSIAAGALLLKISADLMPPNEEKRRALSGFAEKAFLAAYNRNLPPEVRGNAAAIFANIGDRACADFCIGLLSDAPSADPHRSNPAFLRGVIQAAHVVYEKGANLYADRVQGFVTELLKDPALPNDLVDLIGKGIISQAIWHGFRAGPPLTAQLIALMNDTRRSPATRAKLMGVLGECAGLSAYPALIGTLSGPHLNKWSLDEMNALLDKNASPLTFIDRNLLRALHWIVSKAAARGLFSN